MSVYTYICMYVCLLLCTWLCVYIYIYMLSQFSSASCFLSSLILFLYKYLYIKYFGLKARKEERSDLGQSERTSRYLPGMYEPSAKSHTSRTCPLSLIINNARPASFCVFLYILVLRFCTGSSLVRRTFLSKGKRRIDRTCGDTFRYWPRRSRQVITIHVYRYGTYVLLTNTTLRILRIFLQIRKITFLDRIIFSWVSVESKLRGHRRLNSSTISGVYCSSSIINFTHNIHIFSFSSLCMCTIFLRFFLCLSLVLEQ